MITDKGKLVLGKYLINQAPAYASYIAVGCGAEPRTGVTFSLSKKALSGTTVTLTTSTLHDFRVGDIITVAGCGDAMDGVRTITAVTDTTIQYTVTVLPQITAVDDSNPEIGYAKYTTASAHGLLPGDKISISGIDTTTYNQSGVTIYRVLDTLNFVVEETDIGAATIGPPTTLTVDETLISGATVSLNFDAKKTLDFEMFRVPIISRSFVTEDGVDKVVFAGELPTQDRYEMTEVGVYSSATNPVSAGSDSRRVLLFSENVEKWESHTDETVATITQPKDSGGSTLFTIQDGTTGNIATAAISNADTFFASASDNIFTYVGGTDSINRLETKERPRFFDSYLAVRGNTSSVGMTSSVSGITYATDVITVTTSTAHNLVAGDLIRISGVTPVGYNLLNVEVLTAPNTTAFTVASADFGTYTSGGTVTVVQSGKHVHNNTLRLDLSKNSSNDELKLAFSLLRVTPQTNNGFTAQSDANQPDNVYVTIEFATDETESEFSEFARMEVALSSADIDKAKDSLYFTVTKKLSEIITTHEFSWSKVRIAKIYVCVTEDNAPSANYYVALDGLIFENVTAMDDNPIYGLTAYSLIGNVDDTSVTSKSFGTPVVKLPNTNNLVEFKFAIGVS